VAVDTAKNQVEPLLHGDDESRKSSRARK
jgi:hypothetical protein